MKDVCSDIKNRHIVLISIDALNARDYESLKELSYFSELIDSGVVAKKAVGVYPSLTYPSHASIITGAYPKTHGIYDNRPCNPYEPNNPWFFYDKDIKVKTLYQLAKDKNLTVGSFFWPVTAGAKIDYNCPPIWPTAKNESQVMLSLKYGNPFLLFNIERKFGFMRNGVSYPNLDNYTAVSAAYLIKKKKPNLLMVGFSELDHERHVHGFSSYEAKKSLASTNERVGLLIQATKDAGIYNNTTFVILGDHGFLDFEYNTYLNTAFLKAGLLNVDINNKVIDYMAYAHCAGGSAQIYLKENNEVIKNKVDALLRDLASNEHGIECIFSKDEANAKGVEAGFYCVVEAMKGYHFSSEISSKVTTKVNAFDKEIATHGYDPLKDDYYTMVIFSGSKIKRGIELDKINLVDVSPTLAKIFNGTLIEADGSVLGEVLKDE